MNNLQIFKNDSFGEIRTILIDGEPYFVGKDVAKVLNYKDTSDALKKHVDEEDKLTRCFADSGQNREMYVINESGLYSLVFSSKLPTAKQFKRWVTHEVLPSIRKTGSYTALPKDFPQALRAYADEVEKNALLKEQNQSLEIALNISNKFYTVAKYNKRYKMGWNMKKSQQIGREMTAYCKANRIEIRVCQTNDERFGQTNSYPLSAWDSYLKLII